MNREPQYYPRKVAQLAQIIHAKAQRGFAIGYLVFAILGCGSAALGTSALNPTGNCLNIVLLS
jgi:hypothetical protein